ncbi:hypothetical protein [Nioella aestuarii]|uniref:hypothetical protein n=1 Tax=Nioella aestuarii TaxID=1662864 RepID=UPI003D7FB4BB
MTRYFAIAAAALSLTASTTAPASADPITSLEGCYEAVINWCNENFPEHDCSNSSGLDDCDEEFGNLAGTPGFDRPGPSMPGETLQRLIVAGRAVMILNPDGREGEGRDGGSQASSAARG